MGTLDSIQSFEFQGMRTDLGDKLLDVKYFRDVINFNQDDIIGANKVLAPKAINDIQFIENSAIDGIFGYSYLDTNNKIQNERIVVSGGKIFSQNGLKTTEIYSGLEVGLCDFTILNDKLFIANGKNYPLIYDGKVVKEMGSPSAFAENQNGGLVGDYYYEITYTTAGGEERLGTKSNKITVNGKSVMLELPIGYDGVTKRTIYRTEGDGTVLKKLVEINDNETLSYIDNAPDTSLTNEIIEINNECPKPYFLETSNFRLVGCVADIYPTQAWIGDTNVEMFDGANFTDVSNRTKDNSKLTGMKRDYDKIIIASQKQVYILDCSNAESTTVTETRANVGCINGYSMARIPSDTGFDGGILFLASDKTIRLFNGNFAQPVPTSLDNLKTDNFGQPIKTILEQTVTENTSMYAEYYNFKYHLILGSMILVYDIRTNSWFTYNFLKTTLTGDFDPQYFDAKSFLTGIDANAYFSCFAVINNDFIIGRKDHSFIEKMYADNKYRNTSVVSKLEFPYWGTSEELKYFKEIHLYYLKNSDVDFDVTVNLDNGTKLTKTAVKDNRKGDFDNRYFDPYYFETANNTEDYKVIYINKYAHWLKVIIESNEQPLNFRGMRILYEKVSNKEIA